MKFHNLRVSDVRRETDDCVSVEFRVPDQLAPSFDFIPGQYLTLKKEIGGEEIRRSYSICTQPGDPLRVAIKEVPTGVFSTWANSELKEGDTIAVSEPEGNFLHRIDSRAENHYVAFVAGSGITPVLSILAHILELEPKSSFSLFYGNRNVQSIIFKEELEGMKNRFMDRFQLYHILSRETGGSPLLSGRIDATRCATYLKYFVPGQSAECFFLCGPYQMIMDMQAALLHCGINKDQIKFELFYNPESDDLEMHQAQVFRHERQIRITLDGRTSEIKSNVDIPILDMAVEAGLDLPFSCKGGVCATCKAKLEQGEVNMTTNFALEEEEVEQGYILTCQAHAISAFVDVNFDN